MIGRGYLFCYSGADGLFHQFCIPAHLARQFKSFIQIHFHGFCILRFRVSWDVQGKGFNLTPALFLDQLQRSEEDFSRQPFLPISLAHKNTADYPVWLRLSFSIKKKTGPVSIDLFEDFRPSKLSPGDRMFAHVIDDASCYSAHDPVPMEVFVLFPAHFLERTGRELMESAPAIPSYPLVPGK